jgi:hypothetical protein
MITVSEAAAPRELLEKLFLQKHASFALGWGLSREGRTTFWYSPGQTLRIVAEIVPHEYIDKGNTAGFLGDALTSDQIVYQRQGDAWVPTRVKVTPLKVKPKLGKSSKVRP